MSHANGIESERGTSGAKTADPVADHHAAAIASLHARTENAVDMHQRIVERWTARVGRPRTLYLLVAIVGTWTLSNTVARAMGGPAVDPPPFFWMQGALTLYAALVTTIVLTTQNRQQRHAEQRSYLELQVNLMAEQKTAKLISLLEELRRDLPSVHDRIDREAEALAQAVDPRAVLTALEVTLENPHAEGSDDDERHRDDSSSTSSNPGRSSPRAR